jgi:hypothetical protein
MSHYYRLGAWREAGVRCSTFDQDEDVITFSNGHRVAVNAYLDASKQHETDGPVDGGFAAFGNDEIGYGYYPITMITEAEWQEEQDALKIIQASAFHGGGRA